MYETRLFFIGICKLCTILFCTNDCKMIHLSSMKLARLFCWRKKEWFWAVNEK